tara:strand:- start:344 stop:517 length:174 start_codon:yes stop_codon:yes gene_type:complete
MEAQTPTQSLREEDFIEFKNLTITFLLNNIPPNEPRETTVFFGSLTSIIYLIFSQLQ